MTYLLPTSPTNIGSPPLFLYEYCSQCFHLIVFEGQKWLFKLVDIAEGIDHDYFINVK